MQNGVCHSRAVLLLNNMGRQWNFVNFSQLSDCGGRGVVGARWKSNKLKTLIGIRWQINILKFTEGDLYLLVCPQCFTNDNEYIHKQIYTPNAHIVACHFISTGHLINVVHLIWAAHIFDTHDCARALRNVSVFLNWFYCYSFDIPNDHFHHRNLYLCIVYLYSSFFSIPLPFHILYLSVALVAVQGENILFLISPK